MGGDMADSAAGFADPSDGAVSPHGRVIGGPTDSSDEIVLD